MKKISLLLIVLMVLSLPVTALATEDVAQTRAGFIKDIITVAEIDVKEVAASSFKDVTDPQLIPYIETASEMGLVSGYGEEFRPNETITNEQAIAIIVKVFGQKAPLRDINEEDINAIFNATQADISEWAKPIYTYAIKSGLVEKGQSTLNPQLPITKTASLELIETAKAVYEDQFTKDGLSASEMLVHTIENINNYETYKQKGTMAMKMKMTAEGLPEEEMKDEELQGMLDQGLNMEIELEVHAQNPDKAYIKEIIKPIEGDQALEEEFMEEQEIEIFMDGTMMYTKMFDSEKWIKQDLSSLMNQLQKMSPNSQEPYKMAQLSPEELELLKEFARFEEDVTIDDKDYYVISMFIDKDNYKDYYMEIVEDTMDSVVELQMENPEIKNDPTFDPDMYKEMMTQLVSQMEVELDYKYYINKETKNYEKMWIAQKMHMSMDEMIKSIAEMTDEEIPENLSIKMESITEGEFNLYDFDQEVEFPVIEEEDIMDTAALSEDVVEVSPQ